MIKKPKISFVVGFRDPNYGAKYHMNNLYRVQLFLDNLLYLLNRYKLLSELIMVEWNPSFEGEFFNKLRWPKQLGLVTIRWIEVPAKIHQQFPNSETIPIFEFLAKNVGIRRARGDYLLSTNPDVLYSESLIKYLAKEKLSTNCFYRVDRLDVGGYIPRKYSILKRLKFCDKYIIKRHAFYGTIKEIKTINPLTKYFKKKEFIKSYWSGEGLVAYPDGFHRNAAGDFFLMAKKNWFRLRGYAQLPTHSHMDSIMCWQAASLGLKQVILDEKYKLYHIDHDRKIQKSFPKTNWVIWFEKFKKYRQAKKVLVINNDKNWGLANERLKECVVAGYILSSR